jgi:PAS domain S-box-containing protein
MALDDAEALRRLIDITSEGASLDETAQAILRLGVEAFDLPLAIVSRIEGDVYTVEYIEGPEGAPPPGTTFDLPGTYCVHTLRADGPTGFHHVATSEIRNHPCYQAFGLEAYLGTPLLVDGKRVGTINFTSPEPRSEPFRPAHITMVRNFATVLGTQMSTHAAQRGRAQSLDRERAIVESVVDGVVAFEGDGTVRAFNPGAERLFGRPAHQVIGGPLDALLPAALLGGGAATLLSTLSELPDALGRPMELEVLHEQGHVVPVEAVFRSFDADGTQWFTGIFRDITHRKAAERAKAAFISTVSHELRTPLTSIRGAIGLLQGGVAGELEPKVAQLIEIAAKNTTRLLDLINDILDIEKLATGQAPLQLETHTLRPLLQRAAQVCGPFGHDRGVRITLRDDVPEVRLKVDGRRFDQVMANLLSNAIKFSPDGGEVEIWAEQQPEGVRITVADRGPGIDESFRERAFQRFQQADNSDTRVAEGTGLGLSITRQIVQRHHGSIDFRPRPGGGTLFDVTLPTVEAPAPRVVGDDSEAGRVLVVEDNPDIAHLIRLILARGGLAADTVGTLQAARERLAESRYDAVTLDLALPDGNGTDLLRDLREDAELRHVPVVVVSGRHRDGHVEVGHSPQVVDFLHKPFDPQRLLRSLRSVPGDGQSTVLLVEDDPDVTAVVSTLLDGHVELLTARTVRGAKRLLADHRPGMVILDLSLPDGTGADLLPHLRAAHIPTLIFSAQDPSPDVRSGVAATLLKSRASNEELLQTVLRLAPSSSPAADR